MSRKSDSEERNGIVAKRTAHAVSLPGAPPNPQGKGQVGFLVDWHYSSPTALTAKSSERILADYFTSLLILSARFKFKPVFEKPYYLYWRNESWELSLIGPEDWRDESRMNGFAGVCTLHADSTWSIEPSENLGDAGPVATAIGLAYGEFVERLQTAAPLEDELPIYEAGLAYYQRLFAAALGRSIKGSLRLGQQLQRPSSTWLAALPGDAARLLAPPADTAKPQRTGTRPERGHSE